MSAQHSFTATLGVVNPVWRRLCRSLWLESLNNAKPVGSGRHTTPHQVPAIQTSTQSRSALLSCNMLPDAALTLTFSNRKHSKCETTGRLRLRDLRLSCTVNGPTLRTVPRTGLHTLPNNEVQAPAGVQLRVNALPDIGKRVVIDTVGSILGLPCDLIEAFRSSWEWARAQVQHYLDRLSLSSQLRLDETSLSQHQTCRRVTVQAVAPNDREPMTYLIPTRRGASPISRWHFKADVSWGDRSRLQFGSRIWQKAAS